MKKFNISLTLVLVALMVVGFGVATYAAAPAANELVIADFDTGDKPNNIGGDFGGWDKDPNDESQGTQMSFDTDDSQGDASGYSIRLDYDVDSPNPAYNGFWMKLENLDATPCKNLVMYVKGDPELGFTSQFKVELKTKTETGSYLVTGVTDTWQKVTIPLNKFAGLTSKKDLTELVIVFDDTNSTEKMGAINIDNISFE